MDEEKPINNIVTDKDSKPDIQPIILRSGVVAHTLTQEDSIKGGQASTPNKTAANGFHNLKHGRYAKKVRIKRCAGCSDQFVCNWYEEGGSCRMEVKAIRDVQRVHTGGPEELFRELNRVMQHYKLKILSNPTPRDLKEYAKLLMDYKSARYGDRYMSVSMDISTYLGKVMEVYDKQRQEEIIDKTIAKEKKDQGSNPDNL